MKDVSIQFHEKISKVSTMIQTNEKSEISKPKRSLRERFNFGIMYQHPRIYDLAIWLNDPSNMIPKTIAKNVEGNSVLDLGCGTASLQTFLTKNIHYIGIDLNDDFLYFAEKKERGLFFKRNILEDLSEFEADTVVLSDVLHHVTPNHQRLLDNAINCARKKVIISACFEKEEGLFKQISEYIGRRIIDNDGLNSQREGAGWLKLDELLQFLKGNNAINFQKVLSHIHCEIPI
ncbi:MAG: class I SAM-dependent methyltransferase [Asgard group archaeon]|nr:class I SAM-dependent methyltransferase [Asgard group archaeon]